MRRQGGYKMAMAKTEVLRKVEVQNLSEIKKGDLFYSSNDKEGNIHKAMSDGVDLPDTPEMGKIESIPVIVTPKEGFELLQRESAKNLKNFRIAGQNVKNITAEFTKAMNCLFYIPIEAFDDEAKEWVSKYKMAHQEMLDERAAKEEEQPPKLKDLDLTKQTITLGDDDNPSVSLMRGHVDELTYVKAFHEEGWNNNGTELTEEQWQEEADAEKGELVHTYGIINLEKNHVQWNLSKDDEGVEPITVRHW